MEHEIQTEPGVIYCSCGDWWIKAEDQCSPTNEHYDLWESWKIGQVGEELGEEAAAELEAALIKWRRPTGPSVWD